MHLSEPGEGGGLFRREGDICLQDRGWKQFTENSVAVSWLGLGGRQEKGCPLVAGAELLLLRAESVSRHQRPRLAGSRQTGSGVWESMGQGVRGQVTWLLLCVSLSPLLRLTNVIIINVTMIKQQTLLLSINKRYYYKVLLLYLCICIFTVINNVLQQTFSINISHMHKPYY